MGACVAVAYDAENHTSTTSGGSPSSLADRTRAGGNIPCGSARVSAHDVYCRVVGG